APLALFDPAVSEADAGRHDDAHQAEVAGGDAAEIIRDMAIVAAVDVQLADERRTEEDVRVAHVARPLDAQLQLQHAQHVETLGVAVRVPDVDDTRLRVDLRFLSLLVTAAE